MIRIWSAYACNNSSAFRIVARFGDPEITADAARELAELIAAHAEELDARLTDDLDPSEAQRAIAAKYDIAWPVLCWGATILTDREPALYAAGTVLVLQHDHCLGFEGFRRYLEARGATVAAQIYGDPEPVPFSVLFAWTDSITNDWENLRADMAVAGWFAPPWDPGTRWKPLALFRDGVTAGIHGTLDQYGSTKLATLEPWLAGHGITELSITLHDADDALVFPRIAAARCSACGAPLRYLDPRIHDIERAQLVCPACGGLYELEVLLENR